MRGCAAAEEESLQWRTGSVSPLLLRRVSNRGLTPPARHLQVERFQVKIDQMILPRCDREVAVAAMVSAKGNVNVGRARRDPRRNMIGLRRRRHRDLYLHLPCKARNMIVAVPLHLMIGPRIPRLPVALRPVARYPFLYPTLHSLHPETCHVAHHSP